MKATGSWLRISTDMLKSKEISLTACVVYAVIADRVDEAGVVKISSQEIAESTGTSRRTIVRALQELEDMNFIAKETIKQGEAQIIKLRTVMFDQKKRGQKGQKKEEQHSYDLNDYKTLVNNF